MTIKESKSAKNDDAVDRVFASREMQPIIGRFNLYRMSVEKILKDWPEVDTAKLQQEYEVVDDAILFSLWSRLSGSRTGGEKTETRAYLTKIKEALQAMSELKARPEQQTLVAELGARPTRMVSTYRELLEKVS